MKPDAPAEEPEKTAWLVQLKGGLRRKIIRLCFLSKNHGNRPKPVSRQ